MLPFEDFISVFLSKNYLTNYLEILIYLLTNPWNQLKAIFIVKRFSSFLSPKTRCTIAMFKVCNNSMLSMSFRCMLRCACTITHLSLPTLHYLIGGKPSTRINSSILRRTASCKTLCQLYFGISWSCICQKSRLLIPCILLSAYVSPSGCCRDELHSLIHRWMQNSLKTFSLATSSYWFPMPIYPLIHYSLLYGVWSLIFHWNCFHILWKQTNNQGRKTNQQLAHASVVHLPCT